MCEKMVQKELMWYSELIFGRGRLVPLAASKVVLSVCLSVQKSATNVESPRTLECGIGERCAESNDALRQARKPRGKRNLWGGRTNDTEPLPVASEQCRRAGEQERTRGQGPAGSLRGQWHRERERRQGREGCCVCFTPKKRYRAVVREIARTDGEMEWDELR